MQQDSRVIDNRADNRVGLHSIRNIHDKHGFEMRRLNKKRIMKVIVFLLFSSIAYAQPPKFVSAVYNAQKHIMKISYRLKRGDNVTLIVMDTTPVQYEVAKQDGIPPCANRTYVLSPDGLLHKRVDVVNFRKIFNSN
jgi:hypothetical protein